MTHYYPMRVVKTRRRKFIGNIAWRPDCPFAGDLWHSASWQAALRDRAARFGARSVDACTHRPRCELHDLDSDPDEVANRPENKGLVESFVAGIRDFQERTSDPWLHKWTCE
jgi:N-sulfoglucosamine sulfohydrolase